jgi:hypothetical protein
VKAAGLALGKKFPRARKKARVLIRRPGSVATKLKASRYHGMIQSERAGNYLMIGVIFVYRCCNLAH